MADNKLTGLIAALLTPLDPDSGQLAVDRLPSLVERLLADGVGGFYCCGSTGEGMSLTSAERKAVVEHLVRAVDGRVPVIVQVGHNSIQEAAELAAHAAQAGADATSATCPSYFKIDSLPVLIQCMATIARAAPGLPFYYYHIPSLTGNRLNMPRFLQQAADAIPNLAGMKFTAPDLNEFQQCLECGEKRFEVIWGIDEMILGALAVGGQAAIGSTYNVATPLYGRLMDAFFQGDLVAARSQQARAIALINALKEFPFLAALKHVMRRRGVELGGCRLPNISLSADQTAALDRLIQSDHWPL